MRILKLAAIFALAGMAAQAQDNSATNDFPVAGANQEPQITVRETHGDWEIRCQGDTNCFMAQKIMTEQGNQIMEISFIKLPMGSEAAAGVTVLTPLGTLLPRGLYFQVDENEPAQYPFSWCLAPGCFSRFGLTDLNMENMRKGGALKLALFSIADDQNPVSVQASLDGFTAAFDALEAPAAQ